MVMQQHTKLTHCAKTRACPSSHVSFQGAIELAEDLEAEYEEAAPNRPKQKRPLGHASDPEGDAAGAWASGHEGSEADGEGEGLERPVGQGPGLKRRPLALSQQPVPKKSKKVRRHMPAVRVQLTVEHRCWGWTCLDKAAAPEATCMLHAFALHQPLSSRPRTCRLACIFVLRVSCAIAQACLLHPLDTYVVGVFVYIQAAAPGAITAGGLHHSPVAATFGGAQSLAALAASMGARAAAGGGGVGHMDHVQWAGSGGGVGGGTQHGDAGTPGAQVCDVRVCGASVSGVGVDR